MKRIICKKETCKYWQEFGEWRDNFIDIVHCTKIHEDDAEITLDENGTCYSKAQVIK